MRRLVGVLLPLFWTFAVSTPAASTVIDVVAHDVGRSEGRLGGESDPLQVGDIVGIDFVLNQNPHPELPSMDGYMLSAMDLELVVTGMGSLRDYGHCKCGWAVLNWNSGFDEVHPTDAHGGDSLFFGDLYDNSESFRADSLNAVQGPAILLQGLVVKADAPGTIEVDLSVNGLTEYSQFGGWPGPGNPWDWIAATDADLGDLTLQVVPEPGTFALLAMGLLLLRRRPLS